MTDQYTPTWEKVREHYYLGQQQFDDPLYPAGGVTEIVAEFDRWLAARDQAIEAAAEQRGAARGWDEGCAAGLDAGLTIGEISMGLKDQPIPAPPENPYRADQMEGDDE